MGSMQAFISLPGITREYLDSGDARKKKMQGIYKINKQPLWPLTYA